MNESFKTCMFGGFDKQDVVAYIERQAREHAEEIETRENKHAAELQSLRRELSELRHKSERAEEECAALRPKAERAAALEQELARLREDFADLTARCNALQEENDRCKGPAREYAELKDHIAQIEISAHRRTEEFRANIVSQFKALSQQQRQWCQRERQRYDQARQDMLGNLAQARQLVEAGADDVFDGMLSDLQEFEDNLE